MLDSRWLSRIVKGSGLRSALASREEVFFEGLVFLRMQILDGIRRGRLFVSKDEDDGAKRSNAKLKNSKFAIE